MSLNSPTSLSAPASPPHPFALIRDLYEKGRFLSAYEVLVDPMLDVRPRTPSEKILAARLVSQVGGMRRSNLLLTRAFREDPTDAEAVYYRGFALLRSRGPHFALEFFDRHPVLKATDGARNVEADIALARAMCLARLRDFPAAEQQLQQARAMEAEPAWWEICRSNVLGAQDRTEEALEVARHAVTLRPDYRPAIENLADALKQRGLLDEAIALLGSQVWTLESAFLCYQLSVLELEAGRPRAAVAAAERSIVLAPLAEPEVCAALGGALSDALYECGEIDRAIEFGQLAGGFHGKVAARMAERGTETERVVLPVPWVRQDHRTCGPATLTSIARYWGREVSQLEVVEAICFDGTSSHSERSWAEGNGWITRAFTLQWEAAVELLRRGIPFTLATRQVGNAHLQAVCGFDARRGTILIRDPSGPCLSQADAEGLLEEQAFSGPRALALVPAEKAHLLEGLQLPDAALHDHLDALEAALVKHDRASAERFLNALQSEAPGHRITLHARRALARYDDHVPDSLAAAEALLAAFPDSPLAELDQLALMARLGRREERRRSLVARVGRGKSDPWYLHALAEELYRDARERDRTRALLHRHMRARPWSGASYQLLAHVTWEQGQREEALALYRRAWCLEATDSDSARSYFLAATHLGRGEEVLAALRDQFDRFGQRSARPAQVLVTALQHASRDGEAREVLDLALSLRPADPELLLFAAERLGFQGERERAEALLSRAEGTGASDAETKSPAWLRVRARLDEREGLRGNALAAWRRVVAREPLAMDAHANVARLLSVEEGTAAAIAYLEAACEQLPTYASLHVLALEWLRPHDPARAGARLERLLQAHPEDAWALRERALNTSATDPQAALVLLEAARAVEPNSVAFHNVESIVLSRAGRESEARACLERSLRLDVEQPNVMTDYVSRMGSDDEARTALSFVMTELRRQALFGGGVDAFMSLAERLLRPDALFAFLEELSTRHALPEIALHTVRTLAAQERVGEARARIAAACERFAQRADLWLERAHQARMAGDSREERLALETACRLEPAGSRQSGELAALHLRRGGPESAPPVLEPHVAVAPANPAAHGHLARFEWERGNHDAALDRMERALLVQPEYLWGWDTYAGWTEERGTRARAVELARRVTLEHRGLPTSWIALARLLDRSQLEERLRSLERALALDPRELDAHDLRIVLLAEAGRFDEAHAACRPPVFADAPPLPLRGREAWVHWQQGRREEAVRLLAEITLHSNGYEWGFDTLFDWCLQLGAYAEAESVAERAVQGPLNSTLWKTRLGQARLTGGDAAAAIPMLEEAKSEGHEAELAGVLLFDAHWALGNFGACRRALEGLDRERPFVAARWIQVICRGGTEEELDAVLLPAFRADEGWPRRAAADALLESPFRRRALHSLLRVLERSEGLQSAAQFIGRLLPAWLVVQGARVASLISGGTWGPGLVAGHLDQLGQRRARVRLWGWHWRHAHLLAPHDETWLSLGTGLFLGGFRAMAWRWLSNWSERRRVSAEAYVQLSLAALGAGRVDEAVRIAECARGGDQGNEGPYFAALCAWGSAEEGSGESAGSFAALLDEAKRGRDRLDQLLSHCAEALRRHADGESASAAWAPVVQFLWTWSNWHTDPVSRRVVFVTARRLGRTWWGWRVWLARVLNP